MNKSAVVWVAAIVFMVLSNGCVRDDWSPDVLAHGKSFGHIETLKRGRETYATYCVGCHGEQGDGAGPGAIFLEPKPRDFRACRIKFAGVAAGDLPRDQDYLTIITEGLSGTAMPSFRFVPLLKRRAVITYLKIFCDSFDEEHVGAPVFMGANPWLGFDDNAIANGETIYHGLGQCWSCHPAYASYTTIASSMTSMGLPQPESFPSTLYTAKTRDSSWGSPIEAPDFLRQRIKTGNNTDAIARVIAAGVGGTAMPTWAGALTERQLWALATYVASLAAKRMTPEAIELHVALAAQKSYTPNKGDTP